MNVKVAILDYGIGNVKSIANALLKAGAQPLLTNLSSEILSSDACILPGVGAFSKGMENINHYSLPAIIREFVAQKKPFLGICLGMQLLMDESDEFGNTKGLGLIRGRVTRLNIAASSGEKLPHTAWNMISEPVEGIWSDTILDRLENDSDVYFVHSYAAYPENNGDILSTTVYGGCRFCSSIHSGNIYGTQFHPEKSGPAGLAIFRNFISLAHK